MRARALLRGVASSVATAALGVLPAAPAEADEGREALRWRDDRIVESSGLVVVEDRLVTVNDSGHPAELYVVDRATGETLDVVPWAPEQNDVEALAPGPAGAVWVGDIGDNKGQRIQLKLTLVPLDGSPSTGYRIAYPGGASNDAEAMVAHPRTGQLFVVTKSVLGGEVYAVPKRLVPGRTNVMRPLGRVRGLLTDGAFWPDGDHLLLRGYGRAFLFAFPSLKVRGSFELPAQSQGEGLAVTPDGLILVSSEGVGAPVWELTLPPDLVDRLADPAPSTPPSDLPSESPSVSLSPSAPSPSPTKAAPNEGDLAAEPDQEGTPAAWLALIGSIVLLAGVAGWWVAKKRDL